MADKKVADISYFNNVVNWDKFKKSVDAVIIRLGYRGCTNGNIILDKKAKEYVEMCKKHGIPYSIYFFPTSVNEMEAIEEALWVLEKIKE